MQRALSAFKPPPISQLALHNYHLVDVSQATTNSLQVLSCMRALPSDHTNTETGLIKGPVTHGGGSSVYFSKKIGNRTAVIIRNSAEHAGIKFTSYDWPLGHRLVYKNVAPIACKYEYASLLEEGEGLSELVLRG